MSTVLLPKLGLTLADLGAAGYLGLFRAPDADCPGHWLGTWEYRQRAGDGYDNEGERLELSCTGGALQGFYSGLEREGEHGVRQKKLESAGFTRDELHMNGRIEAGTIIITCTSNSASCPERTIVFRKGKWSSRSRPQH